MFYKENENEFSATGPIQITYTLSSTVSIVTSVYGDARNDATVSIMNGSSLAWAGSVTQASPNVTIPYPLYLGGVTITQGAFYMTIPTALQPGMMVFSAMLASPNTPAFQFTASVAQWSLTSMASLPENADNSQDYAQTDQ